jgi:hypothetical protein
MKIALTLATLVTLLGILHAEGKQDKKGTDKNVWSGVYTAEQAMRGKDSFSLYCSRCHMADLSGGEHPPLKGSVFLGHWMEETAAPLFAKMHRMPPSGAKPTEQMYLDILAFILESNSFPAGNDVLKTDLVDQIKLTGKDGPGPVPDFALVDTVGCLAEDPNGWILTRASEPKRTRNPDKPTDDELKESAGKALGSHTFLLLSPGSFKLGFQIEAHKGEKMDSKGFLIRTASDERLNVTWLETLSPTCP